ncbi:MAG: hypothetical protein U0V02_05385 [Anaerolineales bacterium]
MKDVTKLDYVDRFTEQEAGSPVKDKRFYPLQALFAVDNTCQEVIGFTPTGYEPKLVHGLCQLHISQGNVFSQRLGKQDAQTQVVVLMAGWVSRIVCA